MKSFSKQKKEIQRLKNNQDFNFLIKKKILEDIYVYGSQTDNYSDIDSFFIVKSVNKNKSILLKYIKKYNAIVVPSNLKDYVFYFDNFKIFSIKKLKSVRNKTLKKKYFKNILLYSFFDRYFERYITVKKKKLSKYSELNIRILKSYLFSLFIFTKIFPNEKNFKNNVFRLIKTYISTRKKILKEKKEYKNILSKILKKREIFHKQIYLILNKKILSYFPSSSFKFKNSYLFINSKNYKILKKNEACVPNCVNEYFYKLSINKNLVFINMNKNFKFKIKPTKYKIQDKIQLKKIKLIIETVKILKILNLKSNIIRWYWLIP